jgi:isocitrate dehydrogenase
VARELEENEATISEELLSAQGSPVDLGGYYLPDENLAEKAMRPSPTLNAIIDGMA